MAEIEITQMPTKTFVDGTEEIQIEDALGVTHKTLTGQILDSSNIKYDGVAASIPRDNVQEALTFLAFNGPTGNNLDESLYFRPLVPVSGTSDSVSWNVGPEPTADYSDLSTALKAAARRKSTLTAWTTSTTNPGNVIYVTISNEYLWENPVYISGEDLSHVLVRTTGVGPRIDSSMSDRPLFYGSLGAKMPDLDITLGRAGSVKCNGVSLSGHGTVLRSPNIAISNSSSYAVSVTGGASCVGATIRGGTSGVLLYCDNGYFHGALYSDGKYTKSGILLKNKSQAVVNINLKSNIEIEFPSSPYSDYDLRAPYGVTLIDSKMEIARSAGIFDNECERFFTFLYCTRSEVTITRDNNTGFSVRDCSQVIVSRDSRVSCFTSLAASVTASSFSFPEPWRTGFTRISLDNSTAFLSGYRFTGDGGSINLERSSRLYLNTDIFRAPGDTTVIPLADIVTVSGGSIMAYQGTVTNPGTTKEVWSDKGIITEVPNGS